MLTVVNTKGNVLDVQSFLLLEHGALPVYIMQGCNAQGVMGSGLAVQVKNKYPEAYLDYKRLCDSLPKGGRLGHYSITAIGGRRWIVNAITQEFYGTDGKRYTSYDAVADVCEKLRNCFGKEKVVLAIPKKFASDRGGACWKVVKQLIKYELKDKNVILYIVGL